MTSVLNDFLERELKSIKENGLYRDLHTIDGAQDAEVVINGKKAVVLCSNNYLGLANHPHVKGAMIEAIERFGCGSGASRLVSGNMRPHGELEERIAAFKGTESALVFNSGYHANIGIIASLATQGAVIFSDAFNHASIIDGCRLSRAKVVVYPHRDLDYLEEELKRHKNFGMRIIITETVFSMEGDIAPLHEIVGLAGRYHAIVVVDEAHATGIFGENGGGITELFQLRDRVDVQMGTLGKALGAFGAYVAGSRSLINFIINRARSFIFSTGIPPALCAAAEASLEVMGREPERRLRLWDNVHYFKNGLERIGVKTNGVVSPVIPLIIGDEDRTLKASMSLLKKGVFIQGIRPPSVPRNKSRLRIAIMATHTIEHLERGIRALEGIKDILLQN